MKKPAVPRFCSLILCILLLPGCKELFHPSTTVSDPGVGGAPESNGDAGQSENPAVGGAILSAPTGLSGSISNGYLSISWNPVSGAEWYECLISDSPYGYYYSIGMSQIYGTSYYGYITNYIDISADIYIKICAYANGEQSPLSEYYHLSPEYADPGYYSFTVYAEPQSPESIYLSWSFTGGASYYSVLRSQNESGSYMQVGSYLTNPFFEDNNLIPGTTYYYRVEAYSASYVKLGESEPVLAVTQPTASVPPNTPDITEILLSYDQWTGNTLSPGILHYYSFYASAGATYYITWDDSYEGTHTYTGDIIVSASSNGVTLFSNEDHGYNAPKPVTVPSSGNVTIIVESFYGSSGSYAIKYY
jgi:hypothetical protein